MKKLLLIVTLAASGLAYSQQSPPQTVSATGKQATPAPANAQAPANQQAARPQLPPLPSPFPAILDVAIPLTPDQVREVRHRQDQVRRAAADSPRTPPKPRVRHLNADLSPGSVPPMVRLAAGNGSGIAFMDRTGAPWPVAAIDLANKDDFSAALSVPGTNVVTLNASSEYGQGNMLVFLKDMPTPVVITLLVGQSDVDYRLDVRIPARGPNAHPDSVPVDVNVKFNPALGDILDGIVAPGLKPVNVNGAAGIAWRNGNRLYLRTNNTLMSPAPVQMTASQDGTRAYEIEYTPQILVSQDGRLLSLKISE